MKPNQEPWEQAMARMAAMPKMTDEEVKARDEERKRKELESRFSSLLMESDLPKRHRLLETPKADGPWGETQKKLVARLETGLLCALVGVRGSGKTQLGVELAKEAMRRGRTARFSSTTKFLMEIKATYRKDSERTEIQVLREFSVPGILILDEIGRRGETDWEDRLLFELLNDRYNEIRDTILIGNYENAAKFSEAVGPSLVSRINETGGVIECNWPSFREGK